MRSSTLFSAQRSGLRRSLLLLLLLGSAPLPNRLAAAELPKPAPGMLRAAGSALALPLLEAMMTRSVYAEPAERPPAAVRAGEPIVPVINHRNDGTGLFADARPPLRWNATLSNRENVLWCAPLPGPAEMSQPVIGGDRIFVQSVSLTLTCLDKLTGKVLWEHARHALADANAGSEDDKAFRLERYVEYCEREIIGRFGSMKPTGPGRPLTLEERYADIIWFYLNKPQRDPKLDEERLQREFDAAVARIPETWPGSNAEVGLADNLNYTNNTGIASPVTDGARVWAYFATGQVVCYDRDGKRLWMRLLLEEDGNLPRRLGYQAVTPLLHDGRLYVQRFTGSVAHADASDANLHCLDPATGKTLWVKPAGECGYTGPLAVARQGEWYIATPNGAIFRPDGTRLPGQHWKFFGAGGNAGPSPAMDRATGTVYLTAGVRMPDAGQSKPKVLWKLDESFGAFGERWLAQHVPEGKRPLPRSQLAAWKAREREAPRGQQDKRGNVRNFSSPIVHQGIFYFMNSAFKVLSASDVSKDELENMHYAEPLPFKEGKGKPRGSQMELPFIYTDLTIAGDYLFIHGWTETVIVKTGKEYAVEAVCPHEPSMCNLIFDQERMYLRSLGHLWCIGPKSRP
ncbi:MAG: PQQ-binding-like beta-propeller repeat protein [Planctomycetia bacterium]|nr:PQQ-binding-like beta-propeller repeat protein [Planctomycetia bacterium]